MIVLVGLAIVAGAAAALAGRPGRKKPMSFDFEEPADRGLPFAEGDNPVWPIQRSSNPRFGEVAYKDTNGKWHGNAARAVRAERGGGSRSHAGIDLYADPGDIVVAPEDGVIVARDGISDPDQTFYAGTDAVLLELDSGIVVLLGETLRNGVRQYGLEVGSRVRKGQPITEIGHSDTGSHMLHLETYESGTKKNTPWYKSSGAPSNLLDPSAWLLQAKANSGV